MADVNLSVEVTNAGIAAAIANLEELRKKGVQTAPAMTQLATAHRKAMENISNATAGATGKINDFNKAISASLNGSDPLKKRTAEQKAEIQSLTANLTRLEQGYTKLSKLSPNSNATQRLTIFGGAGGLAAGIANAKTVQQTREAFNADPVRDMLTVEKELIAAEKERLAVLAKMRAAQQALAAEQRAFGQAQAQRVSATQSVSRANEDLANQRAGINKVQQAQVQLTRATEDLKRAEEARKATAGAVSGGAAGIQQIRERNAALEQEARAVNALRQAELGLKEARVAHSNQDNNAFQSSFSYFIIAGAAQQAAQAIAGMGTAAITASSQIDRSFADVQRTFDGTKAQSDALRGKLQELATSTPISFVDLAQIATLGNQLGIASENIQSFTTTISQYSAISGQSAEDSATAFGQISNLTGLAASKYSNLASAIEYVARKTVATEGTIQNTSKEITALASGAGFSAQAIVGLAGALSSLAIPPERARGALSLYFGALNRAVSEGGPKLEAFAALTGKTTAEISKLVAENKGQEVFTSFISGLSRLDTVAKSSALKELGLSTIRVDQTMRALSQNVPLLTSSLAGADKAFRENTELSRQYAIIQDTLSSKIIEFQNAVQLVAGTVGSTFGPALMGLLGIVTNLIVGFTKFAQTPIGAGLVIFLGVVGLVAFALASLVGVLALAKASLVVIPWALSGLGAKFASNSVVQFVTSLLGIPLAVPEVTASVGIISAELTGVGVAGEVAARGIRATRIAMLGLGVAGIALAVIGTITELFIGAGEAAKIASSDVSGLGDAIKNDTATYAATGQAITTYTTHLPKVTDEQKKAAAASKAWANVLGIDLTDGAKKATAAVGKVAAGAETSKLFLDAFAKKDNVKEITGNAKFSKTWSDLGLNIDDLIAAGLRDNGSGSSVQKAITEKMGKIREVTTRSQSGRGGTRYFAEDGKEITDFYVNLLKLVPTLASVGNEFRTTANSNSVLTSGVKATGDTVAVTADNFRGASSGLKDYQDAVSSGIKKFSDFSAILGEVNAAQDEANKRKKGPAGTDTSLINAEAFGKGLATANEKATKFFTDINALAAAGAGSFATQLASLGPDAQAILSSALNLSPEAKASLEVNARFAAFLASDAFKTALSANISNGNDAYAQIFKGTGDLGQVKAYIAAQIAGTGAEFERQWAANHPTLPLNVDLINPTPAEIAQAQSDLAIKAGTLTVTATIIPKFDSYGLPKGKSGTAATETKDTLTGNKLVLPATLDPVTLSASQAVWFANQGKTPKEIQALINTTSFGPAINAAIAKNGPVKVLATLVATNSVQTLFGGRSVQAKVTDNGQFANGGEVPKFANGGTWGQFSGPGSGTSDSILARVSAGEYINTASATNFWGPDFFDSLNRKMLPTSFMNMLGAAAGSGGSGPTHVAHVQVVQNNPLTRDPLKQLRSDSEMVASGIWG